MKPANTLTTKDSLLKRVLWRLGSDPLKSWANFKIGLMFFVCGAALIYAGLVLWIGLQIAGIIGLVIGSGFAFVGYVGIFANRFYHALNRATSVYDKER